MPVLSRLASAAQPLRCFFRARARAYGSAAAIQLDYDDCDYHELEQEAHFIGMEESQGWVSERGVQWVIMGDPMAKRHVYAQRLSKLLSVPHISMGTLVRQELHPHSSIYKQVPFLVSSFRFAISFLILCR